MSDGLMAYFGYGSLVNLETLRTEYVAAYPACLKGWRRHWQSRKASSTAQISGRSTQSGEEQRLWQAALAAAGGEQGVSIEDIALLSVHRDPHCEIDGMLIVDRLSALPALDDRERLYDRTVLTAGTVRMTGGSDLPDGVDPENLFVYVGQENAGGEICLLQSYLDAVMAGFFHAHGEEGVKRFIATTTGFKRRMVRDRMHPVYPRAVQIDTRQAALFDDLLLEAGVIF